MTDAFWPEAHEGPGHRPQRDIMLPSAPTLVAGFPTASGNDDFPAVRAAVDQLPMLPHDAVDDRYGIRRLTARWLYRSRRGANRSAYTRKAYFRELAEFLRWCQLQNLDPLTARSSDLDEFQDYRAHDRGNGIPAPASVARTLAALSSWYQYLIANTDGRVSRNPLDGVERPHTPDQSPTLSLSVEQVDALITAADTITAIALRALLVEAFAKQQADTLCGHADTAAQQARTQVLAGSSDVELTAEHLETLTAIANAAADEAHHDVVAGALAVIAGVPKIMEAARWRWTRYLAALRDRALIRLMADLGPRSAEVRGLDMDSLSTNTGQRTIRFVGKGGVTHERPLLPDAALALDRYLQARAQAAGTAATALTGPLLATTRSDGSPGRISDSQLFGLIRRLAETAGIAHSHRISPHSLRHAFATRAEDLDVPLTRVQKAMGHADPRTTRRYQHEHDALKKRSRPCDRRRPSTPHNAATHDATGHDEQVDPTARSGVSGVVASSWVTPSGAARRLAR